MSKLKDFLTELADSLDDMEKASKIKGVNNEEIAESYIYPLQQKYGLGDINFRGIGQELSINISKEYDPPEVKVTAKDIVELAKFLQEKGIRPNDPYNLYVASGEFDDKKNTIRIGIPVGSINRWFYFMPRSGGGVKIPYSCLKNSLTHEIAGYIEDNIVREKKKSLLSCLAR